MPHSMTKFCPNDATVVPLDSGHLTPVGAGVFGIVVGVQVGVEDVVDVEDKVPPS